MNHNRKVRINQITKESLMIGIDIAKHTHYACAVDDRGIELQLPIGFKQNRQGFEHFHHQVEKWFHTHKPSVFQ